MGEQGKLIDENAAERAALSFGLHFDPLQNVGRQTAGTPEWFALVLAVCDAGAWSTSMGRPGQRDSIAEMTLSPPLDSQFGVPSPTFRMVWSEPGRDERALFVRNFNTHLPRQSGPNRVEKVDSGRIPIDSIAFSTGDGFWLRRSRSHGEKSRSIVGYSERLTWRWPLQGLSVHRLRTFPRGKSWRPCSCSAGSHLDRVLRRRERRRRLVQRRHRRRRCSPTGCP